MKPKQPKLSDYFDRVAIYEKTGERTDTGGFTGSAQFVKSIWCDVRNLRRPVDDVSEGKRLFVKAIKVKTRKSMVSPNHILEYKSDNYFVYNIDDTNPAEDVVYAQIMSNT